jgi:uncharacterized protein
MNSVPPEVYSVPAWSPYLVGALIGVLSMFTFYFSDKPIGVSTAYARLAGLVGNIFSKRHTLSLKYFQQNTPKIDWEVMLLIGVIIGAFIAAWTGGEFTGEWVPRMWAEQFGPSIPLRLAVSFAGGLVMAFGARMAGGCTSGHGISGSLQLSVGSWIALICFFAGGAGVAALLFRS